MSRQRARAKGIVVDNVYGAGHALCGQSIPPPPAPFEVAGVRVQPHSGAVAYALVEFQPVAGPPVRFRSTYGRTPAQHAIGDEVVVLYDPADPRHARILGEGRLVTLALVIFGLILAAAAGAAVWLVRD